MLSVAKQDKLQAHLQCKEFGTQGLFQWIGRLKFAVCWFTARSRIWSNNAATFRQTWQFLEMSPFHVLPIHWPHEKSSSIGTASNVKALRPRVFRQLLNMLSWQWQARKKNEKKHFFEKKKKTNSNFSAANPHTLAPDIERSGGMLGNNSWNRRPTCHRRRETCLIPGIGDGTKSAWMG